MDANEAGIETRRALSRCNHRDALVLVSETSVVDVDASVRAVVFAHSEVAIRDALYCDLLGERPQRPEGRRP